MSISPLCDLNPTSRDWTIHVYVSRLWHHRGGSDDGPIKHIDIVFQDTQRNHMYAEISPVSINQFMNRIREGGVYEMKRFVVCLKKNSYRPVDGQYMIRFTRYTVLRELPDDLMGYPLCTYALTPIDNLPRPSDLPESFTDVVGIITGVSPTSRYYSAARSTPSTKRVIYLSDLSGFQISVVLWGERALAFDGDVVLRTAQKEPVVVIFVGTLVKPFEGRRGLSGGAPCRWYINEDLPEINEIHAQLRDRVPAVQSISLPGQTPAEISAQVEIETKTVKELIDLDIWEHSKTMFYCTVVIKKMSPGQRWWFHACTTCNKGTVPFGAAYKCPDKDCAGVGGMPRYRICYIASDDTGDVEFVFFDKSGKELIGKPVLTILRSRVPQGMPLEEAIQFGRTDRSTPRELAAIVSRKYRFVVSVTTRSFDPESDKPSYQVHRIDTQYGRQRHASALARGSGLALASSSSSSGGALNPLGEALAEDLILSQTTSLGTPADLTDVPPSTDIAGSAVDSGAVLPQTAPSVVKPGSSDGKAAVLSSVQRALFQEPSSGDEMEASLELAPRVESGELDLPAADGADLSLVPSAAASADKTPPSVGKRRSLPQKAQASQAAVQAKKKKT